MFNEGWSAINFDFLFGLIWHPKNNEFGIFPIIISTIIVGIGAVGISLLIGIPCAIFLAEFAPTWIRNIIKPSVEMLVGIPSIVLGFFGLMLIVPFIRDNFGGRGECILAGWIILAIMTLPHVITISEEAIKAVPNSYREASLSLGATKWQTVRNITLPNAKSGVLASIVLGVGNAIGETMAVLMVIGNPNIPFIPNSILDSVRVLTSTIVLEYSYVEWHSLHWNALFGIGIVLFIMVGIINFISRRIIKRGYMKP